MMVVVNFIAKINFVYLLIYWLAFFLLEKLIIVKYEQNKIYNARVYNWILLNYWGFFGGWILALYLLFKIHLSLRGHLTVPFNFFYEFPIIFVMFFYYNYYKIKTFRNGKVLFW